MKISTEIFQYVHATKKMPKKSVKVVRREKRIGKIGLNYSEGKISLFVREIERRNKWRSYCGEIALILPRGRLYMIDM